MRAIIVLATWLGACGCAPVMVSVTTSPKYDFTISQVGEVMQFALKELDRRMPEGWSVILVDGYIPTFNPDEPDTIYFGDGAMVPDSKQVWIYPYQSCIADSAITHEIAHLVGYEHGTQMESIIANIHRRAVKKFCPSDYERAEVPPAPTLEDLKKSPIPRLWTDNKGAL